MNMLWENAKPFATQSVNVPISMRIADQIFLKVIPETQADAEALKYVEVKIAPSVTKSFHDLSLRSQPFILPPNMHSLVLDLQISPDLPLNYQLRDTNFHFEISNTPLENNTQSSPTPAPTALASPPSLTTTNASTSSNEQVRSASESSQQTYHSAPIRLSQNFPTPSLEPPLTAQQKIAENVLIRADKLTGSSQSLSAIEHSTYSKNQKRFPIEITPILCVIVGLMLFGVISFFLWQKGIFSRPPVANR